MLDLDTSLSANYPRNMFSLLAVTFFKKKINGNLYGEKITISRR